MMKNRIELYSKFERFWHWTQSLLVILLGLTGFEIHGSFRLFGYDTSVRLHSASRMGILIADCTGHLLDGYFQAVQELHPHTQKCESTDKLLSVRDFQRGGASDQKDQTEQAQSIAANCVSGTDHPRISSAVNFRLPLYVLPLSK
jgi:hypothetical protein